MGCRKALQVQDHQAHPQGPHSSSGTARGDEDEEVLQVLREAEVLQNLPGTTGVDILQVLQAQQQECTTRNKCPWRRVGSTSGPQETGPEGQRGELQAR